MMTKLTLEKIARLSGVSRSTVSRVVNNHPMVKPDVRERVLQVIEDTGYHPDPAARSLAGQRSGIIGLVVPRSIQFLFTGPYYPRLIQGISQACNDHEYTMSLMLFHTQSEEQKLFPRILRNRLADGIIVSALPIGDPLVAQLQEHHVPFVMIGRPDTPDQVNFVNVDNVQGAFQGTVHLIQQGRCRIAAITGPLNTTVGLDRRQGYVDALTGHGMAVSENLMAEGDFTEEGGFAAMQRLLPHRPDAVLAASDAMAMGALRALREAGLAVPTNVAVVGFDDLPGSAVSDPPLTTVQQPIRRLGVQAVEMLIDILTHGLEPPRHLVAPTKLIVRASCGATQSTE